MTIDLDSAYAGARRILVDYLATPLERRAGVIAELRPSHADYQAIFEPDFAADAAEHGYRQLWGNVPVWPVPPEPSVEVFCVASDVFSASNTRDADAFPGGYVEIAGWLKKGVVWAAWTLASHGRAYLTLDGLVEVERGRWVWCPRPWKVLPKPPTPTLWWDD